MLIALILFIIMYVLLLTFSNQRWLVSLGFAALFIITGILPFFNALGAINWNVIMMLAGTIGREDLAESVREELGWQNYMEFAAFYSSLGLKDKAERLLAACPEQNALVSLWRAWLEGDTSMISDAEAGSIELVFPFREESVAPLEWAVENGGGWRSRYLLAMLQDFLGHRDRAIGLMEDSSPDYAPYYCYRSNLTGNMDDMLKAHALDPEEWRYIQYLVQRYNGEGRYSETIGLLKKYYARHRDNFHIGDTYVKALIATGKYHDADKVMAGVSGAMGRAIGLEDMVFLEGDGTCGLGVVGNLPAAMTVDSLVPVLKKAFGCKFLKCSEKLTSPVTRVALCGGSGSSLIGAAMSSGAQVYVTGDLSYHDFYTRDGFMVIDIGHYEGEEAITEILFSVIKKNFPNFAIRIAKTKHNPVYYL